MALLTQSEAMQTRAALVTVVMVMIHVAMCAGDQLAAVRRGVTLVLAVRGTEPLESPDSETDFDAVPEAGEPDGGQRGHAS
jgi:hypothetical protein